MLDYFKLTVKHKWYVFKAGLKLKVPIWQLITHDFSKLTPAEYMHYQKGFFGEKDEVRRNLGWLHHQNHNKHHWDYWINCSPHTIGVQGKCNPKPIPMPEKYVREMVADWMGASIAYTGQTEIQEWVDKNWQKMMVHEETAEILHRVLKEHGMYWPGAYASGD